MQYFITYVLGHQPTSGKKAELGTIVHKVLEVLACLKKNIQDNPSKTKIVIDDDAAGKVSINKSQLFKDDTIEELVSKSYTFYTSQSVHKFTQADHNNCLKLVWDTLLYNDGQFDPRKRNIVQAEPHFDIPIEEEWAHYEYTLPDGQQIKGQLAIKGTIDLVTQTSDDVIEVIDWKTGRRLDWATGEEKTYEKLCSDPQLLLYNYAIAKLYPQYKQSIMSIFFIKDGGPFSMCFDRSDHDKFLSMLKAKFEHIKANNKPKPLSASRDSWKCTRLCHYYKNNWPGTDQNICTHVENSINKNGIDQTIKQCTKENFNIGFYSAPG